MTTMQLDYEEICLTLVRRANNPNVSLEELSTEGLGDFFQRIRVSFNHLLNRYGKAEEDVQELLKTLSVPMDFSNIAKVNYTLFEEFEVYVPAGLKVPYLTHQKLLDDSLKMFRHLLDANVRTFESWLGNKAGSTSALKSIVESMTQEQEQIDDIIDRTEEQFESSGVRKSKVSYTKAIKRQRDWIEISQWLKTVKAAKLDQVLKDYKKSSSRSVDLIDVLYERAVKEPDAYSRETIRDLAAGARLAAKSIEFTAVYIHHIDRYVTAINDTTKKLMREL